jgi:hypothetical protein
MTKNAAKRSTPLDEVTAAALAEARMEEVTGGLPSDDTQAQLTKDELERPIQDADFFDYCTMAYERKGRAIVFYIRRNGKYLTTVKPPCNWDYLRDHFGAGHYQVQCKDETTNAFLKQKSEMLEEMPAPPVQVSAEAGGAHPFGFGAPTAPANDGLTTLMAMIQTQNEQRAQADREERLRDESRRREDRERDEIRRKEERDSRNDLLKTLITAATPLVIPLLTPKEDKKLDTFMDFMKESRRDDQRNQEKLLERIERANDSKDKGLDPLKLIEMLNKSKTEGRKEMEDLLDMVERRATERASQMGGDEKEESTLALLIKNLGPGLAALMAQSGAAPALPQPAPQAETSTAENSEVIETTQAAPAPAARAKTRDELDQESILKVVFPFFGEQLVRMQNHHNVVPEAAARESLALLKSKGFPQERVLEVFSRKVLFDLLRGYGVPKEYDSWFNKYYAALSSESTEAPDRKSASVQPLTTRGKLKSRRDHAPAPQRDAGVAPSGFVPAAQVIPAEVHAGEPVVLPVGSGADAEVSRPLSS